MKLDLELLTKYEWEPQCGNCITISEKVDDFDISQTKRIFVKNNNSSYEFYSRIYTEGLQHELDLLVERFNKLEDRNSKLEKMLKFYEDKDYL